jgi:hypothetical protein
MYAQAITTDQMLLTGNQTEFLEGMMT